MTKENKDKMIKAIIAQRESLKNKPMPIVDMSDAAKAKRSEWRNK